MLMTVVVKLRGAFEIDRIPNAMPEDKIRSEPNLPLP